MKILKACITLALSLVPILSPAQNHASPSLASGVDRIMQDRAAAGDFNGSILVARDGIILYERGFGFANLEWRLPNDPQTKFEIGSMTKQFTALLVLQLVNNGKLRLDGHIFDYLPYYRDQTGKQVT